MYPGLDTQAIEQQTNNTTTTINNNGKKNDLFFTVLDVIRLLCGSSQETEPDKVSSFIFLQKQLAKTICVDGGNIILKYFFGTEDKESLEQENKEWYDIVHFISRYHLQYPVEIGYEIAKNYFLPYVRSFSLFSQRVFNFLSENCGHQFTTYDLQNCLLSLRDFIKCEEGRTIILKLYEDFSNFLFNKSVLDQKNHLDLVFQKLGSLFIDYVDSYGVDQTKNTTTTQYGEKLDCSELVFSNDGIRKSISILYDELKNRKKVPSGFATLDKKFLKGGFENGRVYVFCARPGHGKSILLLNFAYNSVKYSLDDEYTVYVTLENDIVETVDRLMKIIVGSSNTDPSLKKEIVFRDITTFDKNMLDQLIQQHISSKRLIIRYFPPNTSVATLFSWLSTLNTTYKIKLLLVDYLSLIKSSISSEAKRFELGQITLDLKKISKHFNIPVVTASQLNTSGYDGIPTIKNVDESRQIVQHADFVCLLFDPSDHYDGWSSGNSPFGWDSIVPIGFNIDKNRSGSKGRFTMGFDTKFLRFIDDLREERTSLISAIANSPGMFDNNSPGESYLFEKQVEEVLSLQLEEPGDNLQHNENSTQTDFIL